MEFWDAIWSTLSLPPSCAGQGSVDRVESVNQRRMGRKLPHKLQSGRPFTHFYSFFWLWSTGLYSCLTTWVTHFPKLSNSPTRSFLPILLCVPPSRWSPGTNVDHTMLTAHDAVLGPAGRGHTPRLLQRLPLRDAARGGGGSRTGRLLLSLLYPPYTLYSLFIIHSLRCHCWWLN